MDFVKLKNLIKTNGDKFIFVENGEPEMVVMSFREYEKLNSLLPQKYSADFGLPSKSRSELADFGLEEVQETELGSETEFMAPQGFGATGLQVRPEDVRLEDLPI